MVLVKERRNKGACSHTAQGRRVGFVLELGSVNVCTNLRNFCVTAEVIAFQWPGGQTRLGSYCECLSPLLPAMDRISLDEESKESKMQVSCWSTENRKSSLLG